MSELDPDAAEAAPDEPRAIVDTRQQRFDLPLPPALQSLVELEKQRIESFNRRTDVVKYAIEANDAADKRQYEFQMAKLQSETVASRERHRLMQIVTIGGGVVITVGSGLILSMAFLGNPGQSEIALAVLKVLGTGVGGYGIIVAVSNAIRKLTKDSGY